MRPRGVARLWVHTAAVETYKGAGSAGDVFNAPVVVACLIADDDSLVRNKDGEQVVSMARLHTDKTHQALFTPDSRVTLPLRVARVITVAIEDSGSLHLPDHLAVTLT